MRESSADLARLGAGGSEHGSGVVEIVDHQVECGLARSALVNRDVGSAAQFHDRHAGHASDLPEADALVEVREAADVGAREWHVADGEAGTGIDGAGLGATSPLQAMYAREHFDEADLGLLMGLQGAALGVAGGLGPLIGGVFFDVTGSWLPIVVISGVAATGAAMLLRS